MPIRIYTNESVPVAVAAGLQRRGVVAVSARDSGNLGLTDEEQLAYATSHRMAIFTHDTDFLQLAHRHAASQQGHWGIIYVHQDKLTIGEYIRRLKERRSLSA
jgi:predicted nuclease of predicted toxin-antitoxin system